MTTLLTTLDRGRDTVQPALRAAIAQLDPATSAQASYHFGWTDVDGRRTRGNGGKAVRPTLALLSAEAANAPTRIGLPGAVAVELVHNFSLLHDDVMDGDVERRHRRTVWAVWGSSAAILTGDALLALAHEILLDSDSPHAVAAIRLLAGATRELIRGQVHDLSFEQRRDVTVEQCLDMAAAKTGALFSASAGIGAVLAGSAADVVDALTRYGTHLGLAFQLVDDLLDIWGDPAVTGKPAFTDLRARKKSLPVAYALAHSGAAGRELAAWLDAPEATSEADLRRAAQLVAAAGGRDWAAGEARRQMRRGESALAAVPIPSRSRDELIGLGRCIVTREA